MPLRKRPVLAFLMWGLFLVSPSIAQKMDPKPYAEFITADRLKKHLSAIAHDSMMGRETGTAGQRMAAAYIQNQYRQIGLRHPDGLSDYQQYYPLFQDSLIRSDLRLNELPLSFGKDYYLPIRTCISQKASATGIVFAGYGIDDPTYSDYTNRNVTGKVVVIINGEPYKNGTYLISGYNYPSDWSTDFMKKQEAAFKNGAVAVLCVDPVYGTISKSTAEWNRKTDLSFSSIQPEQKDRCNIAIISNTIFKQLVGTNAEAILEIGKKKQSFEGIAFETTAFSMSFLLEKWSADIKASNVIGLVEGSDKKNEYLFVTAHYDHLGVRNGKIYNGADDDGSGTCAIMLMAEAFAKAKKEGKGPRRTVVFMAVSGEEKGLWGSEYYTDHPLFPLENTTADLNIDMIGRVDTERKKADTLNYVYVVGHDKISSELPIVNEGANNQYTKLTLDYKFDDPNDPERIYYRSDHYNFARYDVPVLFFYDGMLKGDYHKPTDDVEKIYWSLYE
ncbi:MAG: M28 family peptidase, partial [Ferruginibacter sp.]